MSNESAPPPPPLAPRIRRWGRTAWAALGLIVLTALLGWLVWHVRVIAIPVFVATIVGVALAPVVRRLEDARVPRGIAALSTLLGAIGLVVAFGFLVAPTIADQFAGVDDAITEAADRAENWVDEERPFGFDGADVERLRERISGVEVGEAADAAGVTAAGGVRLAASFLTGILLALVSSFFLLRDGPRIRNALVDRIRGERPDRTAAVVDGAAGGLRAFLAGAALLGIIEGTAVALTLWLTGAELALVMAALTFIGAFVPFIGAIVAGALSIGVALVTGGTTSAIIVAIVVVAVQQLDNDLLAPVVYGRLLQLHPLVVILAATIGIEVAGLIGAFVTVPLVAAGTGAWKGWTGSRPGEPAGTRNRQDEPVEPG